MAKKANLVKAISKHIENGCHHHVRTLFVTFTETSTHIDKQKYRSAQLMWKGLSFTRPSYKNFDNCEPS